MWCVFGFDCFGLIFVGAVLVRSFWVCLRVRGVAFLVGLWL